MFMPLNLLFGWLPTGLNLMVTAFIRLFVLGFFFGLILRVIEIIRG